MKKITLMVGRYSHAGGLEKYARALATAFARHGCHVTILTTEDLLHKKSSPNIEIISLAPRSKCALYQMIHFDALCQKWLKKHPQDLVFGMERTRKQDIYRAGSGVHKIYLDRRKKVESRLKRFSLHINPLHRMICNYEKSAFEDPKLKLLFTNSYMVKEEICTHFAIDPGKIEVVHNGVEYSFFEKPFLERIQEEKASTRFLFVGNGYLRKGLGILLPALALLQEQEWSLAIVGKDKDEGYFKKSAQKLGIAHKVHFHGAQQTLLPFYQRADVLVIPSLYDPFANVTLEALSMGLFVVSSRFNGGAEILTPMRGAVIEDLFDRDSVVHALTTALYKKSSIERRTSVQQFDFTYQLEKIISRSLASII